MVAVLARSRFGGAVAMSLARQLGFRAGRLAARFGVQPDSKVWRGPRWFKPVALTRLEGATQAGTTSVALVAGGVEECHYLLERFFAAQPTRTELGRVPVWGLVRRLAAWRDEAALTIARLDRVAAPWVLRGERFVRIPEWVASAMPVPEDLEAWSARSTSRRSDMVRVKRDGLTMQESHDEVELRTFHQEMLQPYAGARHGSGGSSWWQVRRSFARGALLWVKQGDRRIAGVVVEYAGDTLLARFLGVADGDLALLRRGALVGCYIHMLDYARRRGFRTIDFGGSRPSRADGVWIYKAKWGAQPTPRFISAYDFFVRWHPADPAVAALLAAAPLVSRDGDTFFAINSDAAWPPVLLPLLASTPKVRGTA